MKKAFVRLQPTARRISMDKNSPGLGMRKLNAPHRVLTGKNHRVSNKSESWPEETGTRTRHRKDAIPAEMQVLPKLFVLDTNVLMHDPSALIRFDEHHLYIPLGVVEELDNNKKGISEVARNARQVSRSLDEFMCRSNNKPNIDASESFSKGFLVDQLHPKTSGRLFLQSVPDQGDSIVGEELSLTKIDNQIIAITLSLKKRYLSVRYRDVVLVSKDINVRIKARAFGITAEDYESDQVVDDASNLFSGITQVPDNSFSVLNKKEGGESFQADMPVYTIPVIPKVELFTNQLIHNGNGFDAIVRGFEKNKVFIQRPRNYLSKHHVLGIYARNREQNFILNLLLDPEVPIVTLLGPAGSGKTLLTIVSGLKQMSSFFGDNTYQTMIMTRVTIPAGEDIGFLPGTEEEKMSPWMGALPDNLQIIVQSYNELMSEGGGARNSPRIAAPQTKRSARQRVLEAEPIDIGKTFDVNELKKYVQIRTMITMRGRTFVNSYVVIDEAQNLTPKQVKMLATRVGPGSKMIFLGNLAQIDTPYITDRSSGLAYLAERFKGQKCYGHVILSEVVRSEVAQLAEELL